MLIVAGLLVAAGVSLAQSQLPISTVSVCGFFNSAGLLKSRTAVEDNGSFWNFFSFFDTHVQRAAAALFATAAPHAAATLRHHITSGSDMPDKRNG
jgi:hypothetical protein